MAEKQEAAKQTLSTQQTKTTSQAPKPSTPAGPPKAAPAHKPVPTQVVVIQEPAGPLRKFLLIGCAVWLVIIIVVTIWVVIRPLFDPGSVRTGSSSNLASAANSSGTKPRQSTAAIRIDTTKLAFDNAEATHDPLGDKNGPYYHDIYTATSTDGVQFTATNTLVISKASVPDTVKLPSGQLVMYAVDGAQRSHSGLLAAVSDDQGKTWKAGSVQLKGAAQGNADPEVIVTKDGQLRLFYVNLSAKPSDVNSKNNIYSATSTDGITFTPESGQRFSYAQITDPDVIKIGGQWFLYAAQGKREIYATSADGDSFIYKGMIRDNGSVSKTVDVGNGKYRQFYCDTSKGISSATSTDGMTWQNDAGTGLQPLAGKTICDPSPVQLASNSWIMLYKVAPTP